MAAGQDGFEARFNIAIVRPKALTRKESSTYEEALPNSNLQDLNELFNTIYRDHNGEDVEVIYCLNEEALAEFDEFDEQVCSRLNLSWQTGNLMTRATKERRHVIRWSVILFVLYQYSRRAIFKAYGPISKRIPPRYVKYAIKLNEYFQKQKEIIEKVYLLLQIVMHKGCFPLAVFLYETELFSLVYIQLHWQGEMSRSGKPALENINQ
jgi:hypothetical protein